MCTRIIILFSLFFCFQMYGQLKMVKTEEIEKISMEALKTFELLVNNDNFKSMGFKSADEIKSAKLGEYLQVYLVRLDMLKKYQPDTDPIKLLRVGNQVIYPILIDNEVRSSITLNRVDKKWNVTSFGNSNKIKLIEKGRKTEANYSKLTLDSYFVVKIPAFNMFFIGYSIEEKLMLTPLFDDTNLGLKAYESKTAGEIFETLIPYAKEHDGLPR